MRDSTELRRVHTRLMVLHKGRNMRLWLIAAALLFVLSMMMVREARGEALPPGLTGPPSVSVEAASPLGTTVSLTARVGDPAGFGVTVTWIVDGVSVKSEKVWARLPNTKAVSLNHTYALGTHAVQVVADNGKTDAVSDDATVDIQDTTAPSINCMGAPVSEAGESGTAAAPNVLGGVIASDKGTAAQLLILSQEPAAGTLLPAGTHPITIKVTDAAGNTSTCQVLFRVLDKTPPTISCPGTIVAQVVNRGKVPAPDVSQDVTVSDNCTLPEDVLVTQSPAPGTLVEANAEITVTAADGSGNTSTCVSTLTTSGLVVASAGFSRDLLGCAGYLGTAGDPITAAPGILHFVPGENWSNFVAASGLNIPYTIKDVQLRKETPEVVQCFDVFPRRVIIQRGTSNIRTWWPLVFETPGTKWTLDILYGTGTAVRLPGELMPGYVHKETWTWELPATIESTMNLVRLFHTVPFGLDEVPLISDEALLRDLLAKLEQASTASGAERNQFLGEFELLVVDRCIYTSPTSPAPGGPGTGIAQTVEYPACCNLMVAAEYILKH